VVSSTSITAVTPAGTVGAKSVAVTTPSGTATATNAFTYVAPTGWYTVLEQYVDAAVVTNVTMRNAITASGLPWRVQDNGTGIEMLLVPAGTFTMGCSPSISYPTCASDENPTHQVTLTQAFYMGRYEVTQAQWTAKMGSNPSQFQGASYPDATSRPVEQVSWNMIASGSTSFMSLTGLRLPTEAEWEYAYRAETTTAFHSFPGYTSGTNDDTLLGNIAWYSSNAGSQTHAVGGKFANGLGLHDMSGNVWEWCQDWYGPYSSASVTNPTGPTTGTSRLLRGGGWGNNSLYCLASQRYGVTPGFINYGFGFRVVRTP
jgi:formylglycine-generating enzyme required for sulfatase activity